MVLRVTCITTICWVNCRYTYSSCPWVTWSEEAPLVTLVSFWLDENPLINENKNRRQEQLKLFKVDPEGNSWRFFYCNAQIKYYFSTFLHLPSSPYCSLLLPSLSATIFRAFPVSVYWKPSNPCSVTPSPRDHLYSVLPLPSLPSLASQHFTSVSSPASS